MPFKFTMLFNFQGSGFSETWYYPGAVGFPLPPVNPFRNLFNSRYALCSNATVAMGWRLSDVDNPRQTAVEVNTGLTPFTDPPDTPTNSWLAITRGVNNVGRRQFWLRCVPDSWIVWSAAAQQFQPVGDLRVAFDKFKALLQNQGWAIRTVKSLLAAGGGQAVATVAPGAGGATVKLGGAVGGLDPNKPMIVSGFRKPLGYLNGTYATFSGWLPSGADVLINGKSVSADAAATYTFTARTRKAEYTYTPIQDVTLEFARERRIGRAFFVPAGRRRKGR